MAKQRRFTDLTYKNLRPAATRYEHPVDHAGLFASVQPSGSKRYVGRYRSPVTGKPTKITFEAALSLAAVNKLWADAKLAIAQGRDPAAERKADRTRAAGAATSTLAHIVTKYYQDPRVMRLRSVGHSEAMLRRNVLPVFGARPIASIKRSELLTLYDEIIGTRGARTADATHRKLGAVFNWWQLRDPSEEFRSPIVRGMSSYKPHQHRRKRVLSDSEILELWQATAEVSIYNRLIRFLLVTGCRRNEAAAMEWSELRGNTWVLPAARNKVDEDLERPLSRLALSILNEVPRVESNPYVFSLDRKPFNSHSRFKRNLDARLQFAEQWQVHDLRRVARSLLSRAGIANDIAELCLGHVLPGIRATYDRHKYTEQKRHAFEALASLIERIVSLEPNVIALRR
jgi:integrase